MPAPLLCLPCVPCPVCRAPALPVMATNNNPNPAKFAFLPAQTQRPLTRHPRVSPYAPKSISSIQLILPPPNQNPASKSKPDLESKSKIHVGFRIGGPNWNPITKRRRDFVFATNPPRPDLDSVGSGFSRILIPTQSD